MWALQGQVQRKRPQALRPLSGEQSRGWLLGREPAPRQPPPLGPAQAEQREPPWVAGLPVSCRLPGKAWPPAGPGTVAPAQPVSLSAFYLRGAGRPHPTPARNAPRPAAARGHASRRGAGGAACLRCSGPVFCRAGEGAFPKAQEGLHREGGGNPEPMEKHRGPVCELVSPGRAGATAGGGGAGEAAGATCSPLRSRPRPGWVRGLSG